MARIVAQFGLLGMRWGPPAWLAAAEGAVIVTNDKAGTVTIELGRQKTELKCRINGQEVELKPQGKVNERLAGLISVTLPAGAEVTVAAMELAGK